MEQGNDNLIKSIEMLLTNNSALNYIGTPIKLGQLEHGSNETQVNENVQHPRKYQCAVVYWPRKQNEFITRVKQHCRKICDQHKCERQQQE